jgi:hypothetical protein
MWPFSKKEKAHPPNVQELGGLIYAGHKQLFEEYCRSYTNDRVGFAKKFEQELENFGKNLSEIEQLYVFGREAGLLLLIDWRGEENAEEIEHFLETRVGHEMAWGNAVTLRDTTPEDLQRDGKFIKRLFAALDKDLEATGSRLLFFRLPWDSYVFMPIEQDLYLEVIRKAPDLFEGCVGRS